MDQFGSNFEEDEDLQLAIALSLAASNSIPIESSETKNDTTHSPQKVLQSLSLCDCKMIMVARTDLGMGKGKIAAQCCHAAVNLYDDLITKNDPLVRQWKQFGAMKVVVKANSEEELMSIYHLAKEKGIPSTYIRDAGHTQIPSGTTTVCALFGKKDKLDEITGHLKLL